VSIRRDLGEIDRFVPVADLRHFRGTARRWRTALEMNKSEKSQREESHRADQDVLHARIFRRRR
jgi:hypothetical protein